MQFRALGFLFLLISTFSYGQGRAPAVEDFVGIEVEHPEQTPPGTEALFNFEKDMTRYEEAQAEAKLKPEGTGQPAIQQTAAPESNLAVTFGIAFVLGLPLVSWLLVMNHLRKKATEASATNIRVFEDYKRERQARKASEEEIRKVS